MTEEQKNISFRDIDVNADFGPTIGWTVLQGRDFSRAYHTDSTAAIVNEAGARVLGFKNPIGKTFHYNNMDWTIIGVTKDMISNSPYDKVQPAVFLGDGGHSVDIIRIKPGAPIRTKEIGVRKVPGAGVVNLWALLSGDFLKLIVLSMAIAIPLIGLAMSKWLQNYPMHTSLSPWIFVLAGAGILFITLCTVSFQVLKAALMNPVKSLHTE